MSRIVDFDDYTINDDVFHMLDCNWGPLTVDRVACSYNAKLLRFNSNNSGVSERVFQRHGRWKSVAAKNGYVKDDMSSRRVASKSLGF